MPKKIKEKERKIEKLDLQEDILKSLAKNERFVVVALLQAIGEISYKINEIIERLNYAQPTKK